MPIGGGIGIGTWLASLGSSAAFGLGAAGAAGVGAGVGAGSAAGIGAAELAGAGIIGGGLAEGATIGLGMGGLGLGGAAELGGMGLLAGSELGGGFGVGAMVGEGLGGAAGMLGGLEGLTPMLAGEFGGAGAGLAGGAAGGAGNWADTLTKLFGKGGMGTKAMSGLNTVNGLYSFLKARELSKMARRPNKAGEQAVMRSMAAQGYQGSGNMMAALSQYGINGSLAASQAGLAPLQGQMSSLGLAASGVPSLMTGIGGMFGTGSGG